MGFSSDDEYSDYINHIFTTNNGKHNRQ